MKTERLGHINPWLVHHHNGDQWPEEGGAVNILNAYHMKESHWCVDNEL